MTVSEVIYAILSHVSICVQDMFTIESITICYHYGTAATPVFCGRRRGTALRTGREAPARGSARPFSSDSAMMTLCARGGLKMPRIVQETEFETTLLSMVSCRIGVAFVSSASRWRCPAGVTLLPVRDFNLPLPFALFWRKDNNSALLAKFTADVRSLVERGGRKDEVLG